MASSTTTVKPHHQPLHNFPLQDLKWSVGSSGNSPAATRVRKSSSNSDHSDKKNLKKATVANDDGAVEEKGKIVIRLQGSNKSESSDNVALEEEAKTWNLRPRKPANKPAPSRSQSTQSELSRGKSVGEKKKEDEKQKFSISLSKEEIEEDVFVLTGAKPVRRPKKRPRHVQKALDSVFPGLWLASITPDSYRVDPPSKR